MDEPKTPRPILDLSAVLPERERVRLPFGEFEIALPGDLSFRDNQRIDYMLKRLAEMEAREWCFHTSGEHAALAAAYGAHAANPSRWKRTHPKEPLPKICDLPVIPNADAAEYDRLRLAMAQAVLSGAPEAEMQALGRDVQTAIAGGFLAQRWLMQQQTIKATADWTKKLLEHLGVPLENVWRNALTPSPSPSASNGRGRPATSRGG